MKWWNKYAQIRVLHFSHFSFKAEIMARECLSPHQALQQFHTWCLTIEYFLTPYQNWHDHYCFFNGKSVKEAKKILRRGSDELSGICPYWKLSVFCHLVKGHFQAGVLKPWTHSNKHRRRHDWSALTARQISSMCLEQSEATECKMWCIGTLGPGMGLT